MTQLNMEPDALANLRHDLCTHLSAIIGYGELIIEECEECHDQGVEVFAADLDKIIRASRDLLETIRNASDPARPINQSPDGLAEIIDAALDFQIRTSLNTILGFIELAQENAEDEGRTKIIPDLDKMHVAVKKFQAWLDNESSFHPKIVEGDIEGKSTNSIDGLRFQKVSGGNLLVVEDNPMNRDILARYLRRLGYTVSMTEDGGQALKMIARNNYDLVLLDIMLPVMDGYQVLQRLKGSVAWRDIPVIMISSLDEIDSVVRCIEMGAEDYLPKPFNQVLLKARIWACLEKKRLRDQEIDYLRNVQQVTSAAGAVEAGKFEPASLENVSQRDDELGQLARVFQRMARQVYAREMQLKQQVHQLRIELDEARQSRQVAEITESEYFQKLEAKAQKLRQIIDGS
jgi:DNA-binding response OmpR family regulator